ncbi:hypothetical protein GCM10010116_01470 [Microbispora rosea subsp. aerata]|nr:hypothetical protein GCM10010116_01470 [Microbispora rosea subsp. aerata]GIH56451.1 hypothetical protein Mro02_33650 [Microbispora rosea subsp. aerata]GLJ84383.1 hypothetical protein GCM10017588_31110 [Microbispora rosea subsp. aerata]
MDPSLGDVLPEPLQRERGVGAVEAADGHDGLAGDERPRQPGLPVGVAESTGFVAVKPSRRPRDGPSDQR